jgi:prepilin-type processing-associated H-X9-DG protein
VQYADPIGFEVPTGFRATWRWAEPASSDGVSGAPGVKYGDPFLYIINNFAVPFGGPAGCPWPVLNCGVNSEPFSFHGPGCNALFIDGHVAWLGREINPVALRRLLTAQEGLPPITDY